MSTAVSIEAGAPSAAAGSWLTAGAGRRVRPRARWWVELLTIGWLLWLYDAVTNLAPLRLHLAQLHGQGILSLERALHIDPELSLDRWLAARHTLGLIVSDYYDNAHFVVTLGLLGWLWWRRSDIYRPLRNVIVAVNLLGFLVFWLYPVAPPRMLRGFTDVVASTGAIGSWHTGSLASHANQLAAMPSLHMAWAGWCAMVVWAMTRRRWLRGLVLCHVGLTAFAVLATGNHYVLDLLGGAAVLALALGLARGWERLRARSGTRAGAKAQVSQSCY